MHENEGEMEKICNFRQKCIEGFRAQNCTVLWNVKTRVRKVVVEKVEVRNGVPDQYNRGEN